MDILRVKQNDQWVDIPALIGPQGVTFTPSVDAEGNLSWTNDGNVPNPPTVNIKGRPGEPGTSVEVHICGSAEYDQNGVPTVQNPDVNTFYLVPDANVDGQDMFVEWVNVDSSWEIFGSARVDLSNYVQKTDYASSSSHGVVKTLPSGGQDAGIIMSNDGVINTQGPTDGNLKAGVGSHRPITPSVQHKSVFYGLATAAGDSTQSQSDNAIGTYTDEAKAAIQQMLDVPSNSDMSVYATKADTVLDTTLSSGRKEGTTIGDGSFAFGQDVEASNLGTFAHGYQTIASGQTAHAEGQFSVASGNFSHAEGQRTKAAGFNSHSEGVHTIANADSSHVEGEYNVADSYDNWPEWEANTTYEVGDRVKVPTVYNDSTLIIGYECKIANSDATFKKRNWNNLACQMNYVHIIGNGTADNARSNAYALDWSGNGHYMGDVYVGANADSSGGERLAKESELGLKVVRLI